MTSPRPLDLRLPVLALSAWASALGTNLLPAGARLPVIAMALVGLVAFVRRGGRTARTASAVVLLAIAVAGVVTLRGSVVDQSWVAVMSHQRAIGRLVVEVRSDPQVRPGRDEDRATARARVSEIEARGRRSTESVDVLLALPAPEAVGLRVGARYLVVGRVESSPFSGTAATIVVTTRPRLVSGPSTIDDIAGGLRDAIQRASSGQTPAAGLVPALVDGDERSVPTGMDDDFKAAGLTHLLAVSGTNFVLLGAAWLGLARRVGVRGRALIPIGLLGILFLVVLARAEPSVIRAAVMGGVALVGMGQGRRGEGIRALSACIGVVMLFDPSLAASPGFALSAMATTGVLLLAGGWRESLARWMPRLLAEPIAVTLAAYIACMPLIVAISGRLSLVALPANLAAGVAVGPATVLGFLGGVIGLAEPSLGRMIAAPATWAASWIVEVAHVAAGLPHPDVGVATGSVLIGVLAIGSVLVALGLGWILRRPVLAVPLLTASLIAPMTTLPGGAWPPAGWVMVACDVGQGDGLVVHLGSARALVVDTGPDPTAMRRCLRDLGISEVPFLVLTHFHSDHVNGVGAVLETAHVGVIEVSDLPEPAHRVAFVQQSAAAAHVPIRVAEPGEQHTDGEVTWEVLAPLAPPPASSDSPPNDASVVLLVQVRGIRMLLSGDEETPSQELLDAAYPNLRVDVLKVAHHGSAKQDPDLIRRLGAREAVISVGAGNQYGLPKASTLALLRQAGMRVHRTDRDGAVAVVVGERGELSVTGRG